MHSSRDIRVLVAQEEFLREDASDSNSAEKFQALGPIHFGRKKVQPSREGLRRFYSEAKELLDQPVIWFDQRMRMVLADAFARVAEEFGYTVWAYAVLQNHAHEVFRVHRDKGDLMWERMALASRDALRAEGLVPANHPVWSNRPYVVFKTSVPLVRKAIGYVEDNPTKHGLLRQSYPWVTPYDGWPLPEKR
jgi:hypothetical protein